MVEKRPPPPDSIFVLRKGISSSRVEVKYYGESKPAQPNTNADGSDNPEGRAQNRRTEFIITSQRPK